MENKTPNFNSEEILGDYLHSSEAIGRKEWPEIKLETAGQSLILQEIFPKDPDYNNALPIQTKEDESREQIINKLREKLNLRYWFLQERNKQGHERGWAKKGIPGEQISIQFKNKDIEIYNYSEYLKDQHIQDIQEVFEIFDKLTDGEIIKEVDYILFNDEPRKNPNDPNIEQRGLTLSSNLYYYNIIIIDPMGKGFDKPYREEQGDGYKIEGVNDNFRAVLIHEFSHIFFRINNKIQEDWKNNFGWKDNQEKTENEEWCINNYAKIDVSEDFSESIVTALMSPKELYSGKLDFIQKEIIKDKLEIEDSDDFSLIIKHDNEVRLPEIKQPIKYKRY